MRESAFRPEGLKLQGEHSARGGGSRSVRRSANTTLVLKLGSPCGELLVKL